MKKILCFLMLINLQACFIDLPTEPELNFDDIKLKAGAIVLDTNSQQRMNGIYSVIDGAKIFGKEVVIRFINGKCCIHSNADVVYAECISGYQDDTVLIEGYVRVVRSGFGYYLSLKCNPTKGTNAILHESEQTGISLIGKTSNGVVVKLNKKSDLAVSHPNFHIIGHRGGGRNSERLGYAENSNEIIIHSEILGATAVEIDIKKTRDNQLIVFHDDTFSPRTVRGAYLLGKVDNFDLQQIKMFGRLINGEIIPTLDEALINIIDNTNISLVWIDVKDKLTINQVVSSQLKAKSYADSKNKEVTILFGIPSKDILNAYLNTSVDKSTELLIELDRETALSLPNCKIWAPRWTNGITNDDINAFKQSGTNRKVFVWTVDVKEYIEKYLFSIKADGILSNYPSLVSAIYYSKGG